MTSVLESGFRVQVIGFFRRQRGGPDAASLSLLYAPQGIASVAVFDALWPPAGIR
ncbi:MAG: hypothetical protein P8008_04350 [Gammaproteobacteria bacterium]